jgi:hypothetical protein
VDVAHVLGVDWQAAVIAPSETADDAAHEPEMTGPVPDPLVSPPVVTFQQCPSPER